MLQQPPLLSPSDPRRFVRAPDGTSFDCSFASGDALSHATVRQALRGQAAASGRPTRAVRQTLGAHILGFFTFYERELGLACEAQAAGVANQRIVSVRVGAIVIGQIPCMHANQRSASLLPIEDPFERGRDLGGMLTADTLCHIHAELLDAKNMIESPVEGRDAKATIDFICADPDGTAGSPAGSTPGLANAPPISWR